MQLGFLWLFSQLCSFTLLKSLGERVLARATFLKIEWCFGGHFLLMLSVLSHFESWNPG